MKQTCEMRANKEKDWKIVYKWTKSDSNIV